MDFDSLISWFGLKYFLDIFQKYLFSSIKVYKGNAKFFSFCNDIFSMLRYEIEKYTFKTLD